jgi:hypothetical protein
MTSNKVDMEIHSLSDIKCVKISFIIFILISSTDVGIAIIIRVGIINSILNRAGKICLRRLMFSRHIILN